MFSRGAGREAGRIKSKPTACSATQHCDDASPLASVPVFSRRSSRRGGREKGLSSAFEEGMLRFQATIFAVATGKKGNDRAATTRVCLGNRLVGCAGGIGADPGGWTPGG